MALLRGLAGVSEQFEYIISLITIGERDLYPICVQFQWRTPLRVSRSLTIKQMAMVASVSMAFVLVFCSILLFHFVQQSRV